PNLEELCKLWANALEEYARSRIESEVALSGTGVPAGGGVGGGSGGGIFDASYADSGKDTEKNFDQTSTLKILGAVSSLVDENNEFMVGALMRITRPEISTTDETDTSEDKKGDASLEDIDGDSTIATAKSSDTATSSPDTEVTAKKEGPLRLIHVVFGLCLEILAKTSSTGSSISTANSQSTINLVVAANDGALQGCLLALHSILKPQFIEKEFLSKVFLEMMMILERVAWMEGSRVQGLVVGVISTVIQGYGKDMLFDDHSSLDSDAQKDGGLEGDVTGLSALPESQLKSIVQLLVELYLQKSTGSNSKAIKAIGGSRPGSKKTTPETIELLGRVAEMLTVLVKVAPPKYQLHLSAVTLNVLVSVLRDPAFQTELGPLVLVNIKGVMESLNKNIAELDPKFLELILNGTLGALLKKQAAFAPGRPEMADPTMESTGFNLGENDSSAATTSGVIADSEMEVSAVEIAEWCNGLLGMMLILTNCAAVQIKKSFLDQFERFIMSSIESSIGKIVTVGYQCLRSIILIEGTSVSGKSRGRLFMRQLIPFVVTTIVVKAAQESSFSTSTSSSIGVDGGNSAGAVAGSARKEDKVGMQVIEEGILTLKSLAVSASEESRPGIISIIMSTVVPLLQDPHQASTTPLAGNNSAQVHTLALNQLLSLGTQFPQEFRSGLSTLSMERRTRLETAIRQSVLQQQAQQLKREESERKEQERKDKERDRVKIQLKSSFAGFT
ncbi:hypothetical protein BGZ95_005295, partial [Linnemannia exigua]